MWIFSLGTRYIDNHVYIEGLIHRSLAEYRINADREFFKHDLVKLILEVKRIAHEQSSYKEKYRTKHLRSIVEGWEDTYLSQVRLAKAEEERKKHEEEIKRIENQKKAEAENRRYGIGCISIIVVLGVSLMLAREFKSSDWYWIGLIASACILYFNFFERK